MTHQREDLWKAIHEYTEACGGDTGCDNTSDRRMDAVVEVNAAVDAEVQQLKDAQRALVDVINAPSPTTDNLEKELARYKKWVDDLQSGMYINCVYCGHCYGPEDQESSRAADVLKKHVENCPEHPMSKLKAELEELKSGGAKYDWHFTDTDPHPPKPGLKPYEHVECLIIMKKRPSQIFMRPWNCEHLVWDDAEGDDFFCETDDVLCWTPILVEPPKSKKEKE